MRSRPRSLVCLLLLASCSGKVTPGSPPAANNVIVPATGGTGSGSAPCVSSPESIHATIVQGRCANSLCHAGSLPAATLDLSSLEGLNALVDSSSPTCDGQTLIVPGVPEQSFFYQKLASPEPICGDRMPPADALSPSELECIAGWIRELGASCEKCGGAECLDLSTDVAHCGACGSACAAGASCTDGQCACPAGQLACEGRCVDVTRDPSRCGACDNVCPANALCENGSCSCPQSLTSCGAEGCSDLSSDPSHCGACGTACAAGQFCLDSNCQSDCAGLTQCGASCVDLTANPLHCGACDRACDPALSCVGSECVCPDGATPCNGSCVDTATDEAHCGACGQSCGAGEHCEQGICACATTAVSFERDVQPILTGACTAAGCHSGMRPKEGLSLETGQAYDELVGVSSEQCSDSRALVVPGSPAQSYLVQKLLGVDLCTGTIMPKAGQSLASQQLETIGAWVCLGASRN